MYVGVRLPRSIAKRSVGCLRIASQFTSCLEWYGLQVPSSVISRHDLRDMEMRWVSCGDDPYQLRCRNSARAGPFTRSGQSRSKHGICRKSMPEPNGVSHALDRQIREFGLTSVVLDNHCSDRIKREGLSLQDEECHGCGSAGKSTKETTKACFRSAVRYDVREQFSAF